MSDRSARDLEQRWRRSGEVADEAAWLNERRRQGELIPRGLELAAFCGHTAASQALGEASAPCDVPDLVRGLVRWGDEVSLRAAVAAERFDLQRLKETPATAIARGLAAEALDAVERWLLDPSSDTRPSLIAAERAFEAEVDARRAAESARRRGESPTLSGHQARTLAQLAREHEAAAGVLNRVGEVANAPTSVCAPPQVRRFQGPFLAAVAVTVARLHGAQATREAIVRELLVHALGYADPVRMRLTERTALLNDEEHGGGTQRSQAR